MNETKTLRDELAMSAPFCYPEQYKLDATSTDQQMEAEIRARYRYADIAMRVRAETMPKAEVKHPEWAEWAARDKDGECFYFDSEPKINGVVWTNGKKKRYSQEFIEGDDSFIPTNWRESKVKL